MQEPHQKLGKDDDAEEDEDEDDDFGNDYEYNEESDGEYSALSEKVKYGPFLAV